MNSVDLPQLVAAEGTLLLPGSKSISNRVLLLAALSKGQTRLLNLLVADDTKRMIDALKILGIVIEEEGDTLLVEGTAGKFPQASADLFLGNAGTAFRSLTAVLAMQGGHYTLSGIPRMHERPIGDLVDALREAGASIDYVENTGFPPLKISPPDFSALLSKDKSPVIRVRGNVSSQFLTALLIALPLTGHGTTIEVVGDLISRPYITMTIKLMAAFGVRVIEEKEGQIFHLPANAAYQNPAIFQVEGDASSASYFLAMGALGGTKKGVCVSGVGKNALQGDVAFAEVLAKMGALIDYGDNCIIARPAPYGLQGIDVDCKEIPDAAMTLAVLALFAKGNTRLTGIASWRVKETDRIAAMHTELEKLGAAVCSGDDFIQITPPSAGGWQAAAITTYDDHRMAMALSLAAFGTPLRIHDPDCVRKTFPDYFARMVDICRAAPVITIDGPSASGKGTVAAQVAAALGFDYLDSGALYRLLAFAAQQAGIDFSDETQLAAVATKLAIRFSGDAVFLDGHDVSEAIRTEEISAFASKVAALPKVREALLFRQRAFHSAPGLVADGRDMGSVVFPDAVLKVFLTASPEIRAERRYKQLKGKGFSANLAALLLDLQTRDFRDSTRPVAPLREAATAKILDTSQMGIDEAVESILLWWALQN